MSEDGALTIRVLGQKVQVRPATTILNVIRANGHPELTGCGCRLGDCGECRIQVRYPGETMPRRMLSCIEPVAEGIEILELPFPWTRAFRGR